MAAATNLRWLVGEGPDALEQGISFGIPWPRGQYQSGQKFAIEGEGGEEYLLDSRELAFWADGSLKWTTHSVSSNIGHNRSYTVRGASIPSEMEPGITIERKSAGMVVSTSLGLRIRFPAPGGPNLFESVSVNDREICSGAMIVASIDGKEYMPAVKEVNIENVTHSRAVVKASGVLVSAEQQEHLPFDVRIYIYSHALPLKIVFSFVHDLDPEEPLGSLGLRFAVPMDKSELYNRHVHFMGQNEGTMKEAVQGLSGLWHGLTVQNKVDQASGNMVTLREDRWLPYVPSWNDYCLTQLSSDGFTIKKRTKDGCSWVKVAGGTRSAGSVYVGSATSGGLAIGMSDFWERYPTQIDLADLVTEQAYITMWMYSPLAEPLDTRPYHDGLGLDTYRKQLDALDVTYEDYEPGFATANGIGRTSVFFIRPFANRTPSNKELSTFSAFVRNPPRLVPTAEWMYHADVFHGSWAPSHQTLKHHPSNVERDIEKNLETLFTFYRKQVEQHRWYGFWDYGDVQHTYDPYRHSWRYDVGGFAWDNSELSTDLWLWLYFLHTGRADVFKMAEAMTRHTGEVDVYHTGPFKGFGTRHGVQHFSDSSKQLRISNVLYRRIYYYLTSDERTGDLINELQNCQEGLAMLDSHRKVQQHALIPEGFAIANIGLDCGALIASWLTTWERRVAGWSQAKERLINMLNGIANLRHGIARNAILLDLCIGEIRECPPPTPPYAVKHLSMLFGFPEVVAEMLNYVKSEPSSTMTRFTDVWLSYCRAYNGGSETQRQEFGFEFPAQATWRQSHSTLTAFAARYQGSKVLGEAAWKQFLDADGYSRRHNWTVVETSGLTDGEEAAWITTNEAARYGVSAIFNLANVREYLEHFEEDEVNLRE
ncbi:hypothetical protein BO94DRAFT_525629 [Aspergillus sclerotioniger CBS 115572]|uniref:Tat pathway signal sequence domain protein n=1 Tax=Aspergillus sclerotioniger CBS 115572 TaxID=1450535 RepID=A0A317VG88_9EURO|nr:hypothetical protein BO94DRAFT_525629 [Aspergillus sclerotioniger CBS 115572]PWY72147.1 hypothetical protein BO94DRAFT_525629 [Aspergillus sclerotioniger CBS 115572]